MHLRRVFNCVAALMKSSHLLILCVHKFNPQKQLLMWLWAALAHSVLWLFELLWISAHKLNPAAERAKGGCTVQWAGKCVHCAPQTHQLHICSLSLHLRFLCSQLQLNLWKGTLRVDGGLLPFETMTESFVKRERPWIYCTRRYIHTFNPLCS